MFLQLEEHSVRKTPNSCTPPSAVDRGKLHGMFRDRLNRSLDCQRKPFPEPRL
jgi:hypothetical protein